MFTAFIFLDIWSVALPFVALVWNLLTRIEEMTVMLTRAITLIHTGTSAVIKKADGTPAARCTLCEVLEEKNKEVKFQTCICIANNLTHISHKHVWYAKTNDLHIPNSPHLNSSEHTADQVLPWLQWSS